MDDFFRERVLELNQSNGATAEEHGKRTYTVEEIQNILGISRVTAYNLVKVKKFRSVRVGGHIRISKKSFDAWLDEQAEE